MVSFLRDPTASRGRWKEVVPDEMVAGSRAPLPTLPDNPPQAAPIRAPGAIWHPAGLQPASFAHDREGRMRGSERRRVGREWVSTGRYRWARGHGKKHKQREDGSRTYSK